MWRAKSKHDKLVEFRIEALRQSGAIIIWDDLPGNRRPDIIYFLDGKIVGEDTKLSGKTEIDFTHDLTESSQCECGHHRSLHTPIRCKKCPDGERFHDFVPTPRDNSTREGSKTYIGDPP